LKGGTAPRPEALPRSHALEHGTRRGLGQSVGQGAWGSDFAGADDVEGISVTGTGSRVSTMGRWVGAGVIKDGDGGRLSEVNARGRSEEAGENWSTTLPQMSSDS
jgi:hypothetical protein